MAVPSALSWVVKTVKEAEPSGPCKGASGKMKKKKTHTHSSILGEKSVSQAKAWCISTIPLHNNVY